MNRTVPVGLQVKPAEMRGNCPFEDRARRDQRQRTTDCHAVTLPARPARHRCAATPRAPHAPTQRPLSPRLPQLALDVARHLPPADRLALVVEVLSTRQRDLDLCARARAREVDPQRDQRQPALVGAADQPLDLVAVKEQLAAAVLDRGSRATRGRTAGCTPRPATAPRLRSRRRSPSAAPFPRAAT